MDCDKSTVPCDDMEGMHVAFFAQSVSPAAIPSGAAPVPFVALGMLKPMVVAGAMAISNDNVVGNSLRLKRRKFV